MAAQVPDAPPVDTKTGASATLIEAHEEFAAHNLPAAETTARQVLVQQPGSAEAMYLLAYILKARNQPRDSLDCFTRAAGRRTPTAKDLRAVALDYILLNDIADAIHWLQRSTALDPRDSEAWYDLARARMTEGNYREAEKPMLRALALSPEMVKAEDNLGLIYEAENRPADAEKAYRLAISWQRASTHPSEQPLLNYGILLTASQRGAEAIPLLEEAAKIAPNNAKCHEQFAKALDQQGNLPRAASEMLQAATLDAGNPRLHYQLGQLYRRAGDPEKARAELQLSSRLYGDRSSEPNTAAPQPR